MCTAESTLVFLYFAHIQQMVLWRLPMALAEVKLDGMLSGKFTDAELAAVH